MSKPTRVACRFAIVSDLHVPFLDRQAFEDALAVIYKHKPDVLVVAGDLFEADAASKFPSEHSHTLEDEFDAASEALRLLRQAAPGAQYELMEGNHDENLHRCGRIDPRLRSLVQPSKHMPELVHWKMTPYVNSEQGVLRLGPVAVVHGYTTSINAERDHAALYCDHSGLLVMGHTHRPIAPRQAMMTGRISLPFHICNSGTLGPLQPEWASRNNCSLWGHAVLIGDTDLRARHCRAWSAELVHP